MTPLSTLLPLLPHIAGTHLTIDDVRPEFDMAQLTSWQRGEAFREACAGGWLVWTGTCQPSEWPAAKRRHVLVYERTRKPTRWARVQPRVKT